MPFWNKKTETRLIVGLGNPGMKYADSRHNIGFMCLNYFAQNLNLTFSRSRCQAKVTESRIADRETVLAKPQTFMNNSGVSTAGLVRRFKVKTENLIVVHDDMDLPVGRIRVRLGGSSGGHKGINSILEHLGNQDFIRVRIGIGHPNDTESSKMGEDEVIGYVLGGFTAEEKPIMKDVIPCVSEVLQSLLKDGVTATMNKFNSTDFSKK
ncbi:MAG: aminoacyl-tRNA hydrolase [Dehalococcoidales bacterium]|nr:aminoacyl-tRNA hydrolase [Dehalococcoidales bacterium]